MEQNDECGGGWEEGSSECEMRLLCWEVLVLGVGLELCECWVEGRVASECL